MREPGPERTEERDSRGGFIVVAVLWILGALATLATVYAVYVIDTAVSFSLNDERLKAEGLFSASVELTAAQFAARPGSPSTGQFVFRLGNATVTVGFSPENARIDLNTASSALLAGLFTGLGTQPGLAETYAESVIAWRTPPDPANGRPAITRIAGANYAPRGGAFPHPGELALVPGLPESLVDRAMPFVTVYSGSPQINVLSAAPEVLAALPGMNPSVLSAVLAQREAEPQNAAGLIALLGPARPLATGQGSKAVRITPRIVFDDGQRMSADIVIFLLDTGNEPYRVLSWRDSSDDPATDERPRTRTR